MFSRKKSVAPPPPIPAVPFVPPPPVNDDEDSEISSEDEDAINANMETPLMAHGSHRPRSAARSNDVFRNNNSNTSADANPATTKTTSKTRNTTYASIEEGGDTTDDDNNDDDRSFSAASIVTINTTLTNFRDNLMLPFCSDETSLPKIGAGLASLSVIGVVLGLVMPKNQALAGKWYPWYRTISSVIGYTYFVLWSVCFYPQVLLNIRRKSTKGLSNDFAILNFMGWAFYSAYLGSMYFDESIRKLYQERFKNESSTVQSNDVAFSVHAMFLSFFYLVQIVYYGGDGDGGKSSSNKGWSPSLISLKLKPQTWFLIVAMAGPSIVMALMISFGILPYDYWLDYFYMLSYFKLCCTFTKYSKQVMLNFNRKSTSGWNIWYNFLECSGGSLSMLQVVLDSIDTNNLSGITGNMAKFVLGLATIGFDAIFFTQHYILYPEPTPNQETKSNNDIPSSIHKPSDTLVLSLTSFDRETDDSLLDPDDDESLSSAPARRGGYT